MSSSNSSPGSQDSHNSGDSNGSNGSNGSKGSKGSKGSNGSKGSVGNRPNANQTTGSPNGSGQNPTQASNLPPEAIAFATRMYDSARAGDVQIFEQALPRGLPPNMTNEKGDSLIMLAAYHGHAPLVKVLIEHGADPNRLNDRGQSPLAGAVFKNEKEVIEELLKGNADPDHGSPSAMEAVVLFKQEEAWKKKFEEAPGKGKAVSKI